MFVITYATINQSDPTVSVAVGNGADHLFGILVSQSYMDWVIMCDGFSEVMRSWKRQEVEKISDEDWDAWIASEIGS